MSAAAKIEEAVTSLDDARRQLRALAEKVGLTTELGRQLELIDEKVFDARIALEG
jgi:hypothetical protein